VRGTSIQTWPAKTSYWPSVTETGVPSTSPTRNSNPGPCHPDEEQLCRTVAEARRREEGVGDDEDGAHEEERAEDVAGVLTNSRDEDRLPEHPVGDGDDGHEQPDAEGVEDGREGERFTARGAECCGHGSEWRFLGDGDSSGY
jgi:hypothetical protein